MSKSVTAQTNLKSNQLGGQKKKCHCFRPDRPPTPILTHRKKKKVPLHRPDQLTDPTTHSLVRQKNHPRGTQGHSENPNFFQKKKRSTVSCDITVKRHTVALCWPEWVLCDRTAPLSRRSVLLLQPWPPRRKSERGPCRVGLLQEKGRRWGARSAWARCLWGSVDTALLVWGRKKSQSRSFASCKSEGI